MRACVKLIQRDFFGLKKSVFMRAIETVGKRNALTNKPVMCTTSKARDFLSGM